MLCAGFAYDDDRCRSVLADVRRGVCYVGGRLVFGLFLLLCGDKHQKFLPLMNEVLREVV